MADAPKRPKQRGPKPGSADWPKLPDGRPVPENSSRAPCKTCIRMGRPCQPHEGKTIPPPSNYTTSLNAETIEAIGRVMHVNPHFSVACRALGIDERVGRQWLLKGRRDRSNGAQSLYRDLVECVETSSAEVENLLVGTIYKVATDPDNPCTDDAKWLLARMAPERWNLTTKVDVRGGIRVDNRPDPLLDAVKKDPAAAEALETILDAMDWNPGDEEDDDSDWDPL